MKLSEIKISLPVESYDKNTVKTLLKIAKNGYDTEQHICSFQTIEDINTNF